MDRRKLDEKPSIIQKIVYYDKPNTLVPNEILLQTKTLPLGKGDIVISRFRKPSLSKKNSSKNIEAASKFTETSEEESDDQQDDVSNENDETVTINNNLNDAEAEVPSEVEFSEEPKQNSKTVKKTTVTEKASSSKDTTTFKKPRGPAKKAEGKPQRITMLNYITVESKVKGVNQLEQNVEDTTIKKNKTQDNENENQEKDASKGKTIVNESPSSPKAGMKRPRGRPRKQILISKEALSEVYFDDEDVEFKTPTKSKKYAELTNVSLHPVVDELDELLDNAEEQVSVLDRVERELQMIVGEDGSNTPNTEGKRMKKNPKITVLNCKQEVNEVDEQESVSDLMDGSGVEDLCSEGDSSRGEWMPEEYAKYRQEHKRKQQGKTFPCKFCKMEFMSYYAMRKHRALEHDDLGKDRKESVACKVEKDQDDSDEESRDEWMPQDYADYKLKHKLNKMKRVNWYKCKICCAVFSNYYKLSKHKLEHSIIPNPYECKHCDDRFNDIESLMAHIRVHQGKDPYQCKKCDKGFVTKEELEDHQSVHVMKKQPTPPKRFRCDVCSKEFNKLCDIERHTRVHTGEKPCECNICHKRFQQSHNLSKHLLTHLHVKPFQCEICNKKFGRVDVLNRHLLTHSMQKPFNCTFCRKGFIREVQLMNHNEKFHMKAKGDDAADGEGEERAEEEEEELDEDELDENGVEIEEGEEVTVVA